MTVSTLRWSSFTSHHDLVALRRDLHTHPELRFTEHRTQAQLKSALTAMAEHYRADCTITEVAQTGLIVTLPGTAPGPAVLLRADMDAYPVTEDTGLPYSSEHPGVAHACGHDVHMTVLMGVLDRLLAEPPARGTITALFQPGEEIPYGQPSGARTVLESGLLADSYDAVLGLHCWPDLTAGQVGINPVISMAAKDAFQIDISGVAAHVASGHLGRDAILAAATVVETLHATMGRRRDALSGVGFNIGTISGGASQSQVAPYATMTGTLRTHEPEVRQRLRTVIEQVAAGVALSHDLCISVTWSDEMPAVINDPGLVRRARELTQHGFDIVELSRSPMTADDFALLTTLGPGLYLKLGTTAPGRDNPAPLHASNFEVDENCLPVGVAALETLTRQVLEEVLVRKENQ